MRIFYIDYENRPAKVWCNYIDHLPASDEVILYFSEKAPTIPIKWLSHILSAKCKWKTIEAEVGTCNALDFRLISDLSQRVLTAKKSEHIIISCDQGYDVIVRKLSNDGYKVMRLEAINDHTLRHLKDYIGSEHIPLNKENEGG